MICPKDSRACCSRVALGVHVVSMRAVTPKPASMRNVLRRYSAFDSPPLTRTHKSDGDTDNHSIV